MTPKDAVPAKQTYMMIGGGEGAFIGAVHRMAARLTGRLELKAASFSRNAEKNALTGAKEGLDPTRVYKTYQEAFTIESKRPYRPSFVAIVTPNDSHAPIAIAAMEAGFDVLCDKPMADNLEAAQLMVAAAKRTGRRLGITHTYTGYPMVKQARALVTSGAIGKVRRVAVSYLQDWLSEAKDDAQSMQAQWRTDPTRSGEAGAFGDIGTHAFNLAEYMTGEAVLSLCADVRAAVEGRRLDDDGACLLRFANGARGTLTASQVCTGEINALSIHIYGDQASLFWAQEDPNRLRLLRRDAPEEIWTAGSNRSYLLPSVRGYTRVPAGHPEGYIEAFANIYQAFSMGDEAGYASAFDALQCLKFVRATLRSSQQDGQWVKLESVT